MAQTIGEGFDVVFGQFFKRGQNSNQHRIGHDTSKSGLVNMGLTGH